MDTDSDDDTTIQKENEQTSIVYRLSFSNVIYDVCRCRQGWRLTESDTNWDFNWADVAWIREFYDRTHFDDHQRVNHFRNHYELTRKDLLVKNLKRIKRQIEKTEGADAAEGYAFFPTTFVLPQDYSLLLEEFKRVEGNWIMKPIGRSQGKGIFLFDRLSQIKDWKVNNKWLGKPDPKEQAAEVYIAQRYIQRPYLIGNKKFDMRLYCLVDSFSPLVAWIHRNGFARFSNTKYSESRKDLQNTFMHLTNHSVQKTADSYDKDQGVKWSVHDLRVYLYTKHTKAQVDKLFDDIQDLIIKSLLSVQPVIMQDKHSFELYGYDVLFDQDLKPWLLEVNASPSITKSNAEDHQLKFDVLNDLIDVIDIECHRRGDEVQVRGFDLVYHGEPMGSPCMIGCHYEASKIPDQFR